MGIAVDRASIGTNFGDPSSSTITLTTTASVAPGATILLAVGWFNVVNLSTVTDNSGSPLTWVIDKQGADAAGPTSSHAAVVRALAPAGLASGTVITATFSAGAVARTIGGCSFTGIDTVTPLGTVDGPKGQSVATTVWTTNSVAIGAGSLLFASVFNETTNATETPTAPSVQAFFVNNTVSPNSAFAAYRIETGAGSYTVAGAWSSAVKSGTVAVEYKAASTGAISDYAAPWRLRPPGRLSPASQTWAPARGVDTATAGPANLAGAQSDTVGVADATSAKVTLARTTTDTVTLADAAGRATSQPRATAETLTATDTTTRTQALPRPLAETVTTVDTIAKAPQSLARAAADTATVADVQARVLAEPRAAAESVSAADTSARAITVARAQAEAVTVADTTARAAQALARSTSDPLTVTDANARARSAPRAQTETLTVTETATRALTQARAIPEPITVNDTTSTGAGASIARSQSDTVTAGDTTSRGLSLPRAVADQVMAVDACGRSSSRTRATSDSLTAADASARTLARSRAISDTVTAADTAARQLGLPRTVGEPVTLTDLTAAANLRARAVLEAMLLVDATAGTVINPSGFRDITIVAELDQRRLTANLGRTRDATLNERRDLAARLEQPARTATITRPWRAT